VTSPFKPPMAVALNAIEGYVLYLRGHGGKGLREESVLFAQKLGARREIDEEEARKLRAWFARFQKNKKMTKARLEKPTSPAAVAWLLKGGDAAIRWLEEIEFYLLKIPTRGEK
jgi:hypothetical protein